MTLRIISLSLLLITIFTDPAAVVAQNLTSTCSADMDTFCATEGNRYCFLSSDNNNNGTAICGNCLPGYVEWRSRCLSEDQVDLALFLDAYQPLYLTTLSDAERANVLLATIRFIAQYQNQNPPLTFQLGLNQFSADTEQDQQSLLGFTPQVESSSNAATSPPVTFQSLAIDTNPSTIPAFIDWVAKGVVTSVKDQARCGCCWAISTAGAVEGAAALQNDFLESLSFQQFISCDDRNLGCDGGSLVYAMAYPILDTDGIARATDYPFTDGNGKTTYDCNTKVATAVAVGKGSIVLDYYDDLTFEQRLLRMKAAVAKQPVAMVMKAGCKLFSNYNSGILTSDDGCECTEPTCADHAILMVGYNDTSNPPYWKLKNSWGTGWGEEGYFRVAQTRQGDFGLFGILTHGVVPDLTMNMTSGTVSDSDSQLIPEQQDEPLAWWAWLLIILAALVLAYALFSCGTAFFFPRKKAPQPQEEQAQ